jgi:hypothetical protein
MTKQDRAIRSLQTQLRDVQAFLGVLAPVFELVYKRGKWNWEGKKKPAKKPR